MYYTLTSAAASNLALYSHGELAATGCLDVGGRLIKLTGKEP